MMQITIQQIQMLRPFLLLFFCLIVQSCERLATPKSNDASSLLHPLTDPVKLSTLGDRGANSRIQKITAILWLAKADGRDPVDVANGAVTSIGWDGTEKGRLTAAAMVRNLTILERLGGTTPEDLEDLRRGKTALVRTGPYAGEVISVDHIIPRAVAPELDNVIANLELMPLSVNQKKNNTIGDRQRSLARHSIKLDSCQMPDFSV
jgi:hypothetical protein